MTMFTYLCDNLHPALQVDQPHSAFDPVVCPECRRVMRLQFPNVLERPKPRRMEWPAAS